MNKYLIPFLFTAFFSQASYAIHAYRSEDCVSASHSLNYLGNYPYGGFYGLSKVGHENEEESVHALPLYENDDDVDVVFDTSKEVIITKEPTEHGCLFDYDEWSSTKDVSILKITEAASALLGLKQGDVLSFSCEEASQTPNGHDCDEY
jgi:hypothetical protein